MIAAQILVNEELCADVAQEGVFAELESGRPMRMPAEFRKKVENWGK